MRRPALGIALLASIWGGSYLFNEIALRELSPGVIVWSRVTLGALTIWPLAILSGATTAIRSHLRPLVVTGVVQIAIPITLITVGQQWIASLLAGVLNGSVPIFVALFALVIDRSERSTGVRVAGIAIGFLGVVAVYGLDVGTDRYALLGAICLTGSSIGYAIGPLYAKTRLAGVEPLGIVAVLLTTASVVTLPLALTDLTYAVPSAEVAGSVAMVGVAGTGLAFALYYRIMQAIGPARTSVVAYLIPAVAVLYGATLLDEPVGDGIAIGLALIGAGSYLTARRSRVPPKILAVDLYEHQGKELFARYGIPTGEGRVARTPEEARAGAEALGGGRVVVKAQVLAGGRGKAGGVKVADDPADAEEKTRGIFGLDIKGHITRRVWVEKAISIDKEYYFSITFDRGAKANLFMLSTMGGMDIEAVAVDHPDKLARIHLNPAIGLQPYFVRRLLWAAGVPKDEHKAVGSLISKAYQMYLGTDAMLVEVNPLVITAEGDVVAADAKVTIDDNALFRHSDIEAMRDTEAADPQEQMARERHVTYVKLDGTIGILGNGAGLVMSTLDVVDQVGGKPANFLDVGGGADADKIVTALEVILSDPKVEAILFNIFGGITRCDEVAKGILAALEQLTIDVPIVVRLDGTNDVEGRKLLADAAPANVYPERTMLDAARKVVELAKGR